MVEGDGFLSMAVIPILMFVVLAYYAFRLLVLHDIQAIRGKNDHKKLKDQEQYAKAAGELMIFLAVGSLVMIAVMYVNVTASVVVVCIWIVIFMILWKKMDDKYGEK